jgi:hypothetical protein
VASGPQDERLISGTDGMPEIEHDRAHQFPGVTSDVGQTRTSTLVTAKSALAPGTDIVGLAAQVRKVPILLQKSGIMAQTPQEI